MSKKKFKTKTRINPALVIILVLSIILATKTIATSSNHVLGITYLAKGGDDSGGGSGSGSSGGGGSDNNSGSSNSGSSNDNNDSHNESSNDSGSSSSNSNESKSSSETSHTEIQDQKTETRIEQESSKNESQTEIKLSESERIRARTKDGTSRIDITSGGIKTRFEVKDDKIVIKAELEDGTETELEDDNLSEIEQRLEEDNIRVATASAGRFVLQRGTTGAITNFPLSIDLATNALTVNTPSGQKTVAVLPDQAIQNILAANVISKLGGKTIADQTTQDNLTSVDQFITLGEKNGIPVYEINGLSNQKLLGFIPVSIEKTVSVSAQDGKVTNTQESLINRLTDLISF